MNVKRIVPNIATADPVAADRFYRDILGLELVMDQGWIRTYAGAPGPVQVSIATQGGAGTPVPDLSIEVDDVDAIFARCEASGLDIVYPLTDEPWGVRRFYVRDPFGKTINILHHCA